MVDRLGQGDGPGNQVSRPGRRSGRHLPGQSGDLVRVARRQGGHYLRGAGQRPAGHRLLGRATDPVADRAVAGHRLARGQQARADQRGRGRHQRVAGQVRRHVGGRTVGRLRIAARVAEEANRRQVQEHRAPPGPDQPGGPDGGVVGGERVAAVGGQVVQAGAVAVGGRHPPGRRRHADPDPVVLADEQQRDRDLLVRGVAGGADRTHGGGVAGRGVAERGDRHRVARPRAGHPQLGRPADAERDAERARQVRGDRRRLRDDGQLGPAEHLVPPARDRLVGGRRHAEQDVPDRVYAGHLAGPGAVEPAGPVVQQRRVGRPQRRGQRGVALVAGRADRVVAAALLLHPPGREVQVPAFRLGVEHGQQGRAVEAAARTHRRCPWRETAVAGPPAGQAAHGLPEVPVKPGGCGHPARPAAASTAHRCCWMRIDGTSMSFRACVTAGIRGPA